nr:MAG TPA_asm: tail protein [Bacteriophage sp.]
MLELKDNALQRILPSSISGDATVKEIVQAISGRLAQLGEQAELVLILPRIKKLPEEIVDELAWQYHVDFYDVAADITKKRELVRKAIARHRYKGTPAAVEEVCSAAFDTAEVVEWYEYGGEPYHFRVRMVQESIPDETAMAEMVKAVNSAKNTRSWLDSLVFCYRPKGTVCVAGAVCQHKKIFFRM